MEGKMMDTRIKLTGPQVAAPEQCGSCRWFDRDEHNFSPTLGNCRARLPPTVMREATEHGCRVQDSNGCALWRPSGKTYFRESEWTVGGMQ